MTFSAKIRTYLVAAALLPALLIMIVIYFSSIKQIDDNDKLSAADGLEQYARFDAAYKKELRIKAVALAQSEFIKQATVLLKSKRGRRISLGEKPVGFDFVEILDGDLIVLASAHRPGLLGSKMHENIEIPSRIQMAFLETVEYDNEGEHASNVCLVPTDSGIYLYTGWFINEAFRDMIGDLISANIELVYRGTNPITELTLQASGRGQIYDDNGKYYALLSGGIISGYYLIARFNTGSDRPLIMNLISMAGIVGLIAAILAIILGMFITGKAKKEIDNLLDATARVAAGDFNTTVMAYEEGEFSQLADSFSEMVSDLKAVQKRLATSEKIAAWKIVGQKFAHEIKNPLTPIAISIDDLRRSYQEDLPDFEKTLLETTSTVKIEITRLTKILDQFVSFARMNPPVIGETKLMTFIDNLSALYKNDIDSGKLKIVNQSAFDKISLDSETIRQVLINLIKNSFESSADTQVTVYFRDKDKNLEIRIEDNGPGFKPKIIDDSFTPYVTTKKEGSGLGLAICQRIVFDHNGTIEIYNRKERGAGVVINIPV